MQDLLNVVLPVFIVIGFGYVATWRGYFADAYVDGLMKFTQNFAIPCLLFSAISRLDLSQSFDLRLLVSFYTGATTGFVLGLLGARYLFNRPWEDSVAIGFIGLFSNSLLLGLPITERAYGADALAGNYAIISVHSPFCYMLGITVMEIVRARGKSPIALAGQVAKAMFRNALVVGLILGFIVNLTQVTLPTPLTGAIDLMVRAALPAALFGLGGVLVRYRPEGDTKVIAYVLTLSLVLHPLIAWGLTRSFDLPVASQRSAVMTAAMAPGINAYVFANMYGVGRRVAASSVLIGTALCILTVWVWLQILP
ncbi:AEC family transporter [Thalassobius sp. S69A]|uniref:AEC family transporter n=1 Tax=unclassified Thalassovita TaxID=2619711 RepID=UPI000C10FFF0|nr:malonate transporter [Paracoccaceae bacterium]MBT26755.1 malonate transporter [Paracoccaceae bacterium]